MPEIEPSKDEKDEKEREEEEREQALLLRKQEKPGIPREKALEAQIARLQNEVQKLTKQLEKSERKVSEHSKTRRNPRMSLAGTGGLLTTRSSSFFWSSGSHTKLDKARIEERRKQQQEAKNRNNHPIMRIDEDPEDPEVEELILKEGHLTNKSLAKLQVKPRLEKDKGRSGFRMLMEAREDDTVSIVRVNEGTFSLPSLTRLQVKLKFIKQPRRVLVIKKPGDEDTIKALHDVIDFLGKRKVQVVCEQSVVDEVVVGPNVARPLFLSSTDILSADIDFIVSLGGDGTILWACGLFPQGMPPVVSFKMGSLGFLTPFPIEEYQQVLRDILKKDKEVTVRARLQVTLKRDGRPDEVMSCLNEVVAKHPSKMISLDLYNNDNKLTTVFADGLIVATPTGSTAYSLACGGSMVHPAIPAMVVTPIAPHTLSFRPIVLADSSTLRLVVPEEARSDVYLTLDGRNSIVLTKLDEVLITVSQFPVAAYCKHGESSDWFGTIKESFLWNVRTPQKAHNQN